MAEANPKANNPKEKRKNKRRGGKEEKTKKIPKLLDYLFHRNGLHEKGVQLQPGGFVKVDDILDIYSEYTEEDLYEVASSSDAIVYRQCPETGGSQIKMGGAEENGAVGGSDHQSDARRQQSGHRQRPHQSYSHTQKPCDTKLSKFLSWLLRHGAENEGFRLQSGGFLYVEEILHHPKADGYSEDDVQRVVDTNEKQRFYMEPHPENGRLRIRANQGHSMKVDDLALTRITSAEEFPVVVHGTYNKNWKSIKKQGLKRMRRTHIHFASGEPGEEGVISGMRGTCDILIYIHLSKALEDGLEFYISANNVILSPGDADGGIKPKYFASAFQRSPRIPLI